ncbi:hypothetical protein ACQP1U_08485 [Actinomycetota bacterium]
MPSYRAGVAVRDVLPGHRPEEVLPAAVSGVSATHLVEDSGLDIVRGVPRIEVRFLVEVETDAGEDEEAREVARRLAAAVGEVASWGDLRLRRRQGGRWLRLPV